MSNIERFTEHLRTSGVSGVSESTILAYASDVRAFEEFSAHKGALVDESTVVSFLKECGDNGNSRETIRRKISALRRFFSWFDLRGHPNPMRNICSPRRQAPKPRSTSIETVGKILLAMSGTTLSGLRDRAMVCLAAVDGLSSREVTQLDRENVDDAGEVVFVKGRHSRSVVLGAWTKKAMSEYLDFAAELFGPGPNDPLFLNKHKRRISDRSFRRRLSLAVSRCELDPSINCRALRNTCAFGIVNRNGYSALKRKFGYMSKGSANMYRPTVPQCKEAQ